MEAVKLLATFLLILALLTKRVSLAPVMLGASALLAILHQTAPIEFIIMVSQALSSKETLELGGILASIMVLEHFLRQEGYLERTINDIRILVHNSRIVIALLPAFIGLMPSAGGALFSAPLVEAASNDSALTPEQKSFVNYYYRHVMEYFLPIYPGILLAAGINGLEPPKLTLALFPFGLLSILLGIPILRKFPKISMNNEIGIHWKAGIELLINTLPVLVVLGLVFLIKLKIWLSVCLVLLFLFVYHRFSLLNIYSLVKKSIRINTIFMVFTIMVFKQVLVDTNSINGLLPLLTRIPVPEYVIFYILNFFIGLLTGLTIAPVGIGFPLAMASMGGDFSLCLIALIFVAGYSGVILSPMHLCLILTVDYFKSDLRRVLQMLVIPQFIVVFASFAYYLMFREFF